MVPAVFQRIVGRALPGRDALLPGYRRCAIRGKCYPGVAARPGERTAGVLYEGLEAAELRRLDDYEGRLYRRIQVSVEVGDGEALAAWCYVMHPRHRHRLIARDWSVEEFRHRSLKSYLARI
jgi:gamma-glutamylcyclotransferase (GGCT)/AIG2-like uncharacterized protein YtfP